MSRWKLVLIVVVLGLAGAIAYRLLAGSGAPGGRRGMPGSDPDAAVAVSVAKVTRADVPVVFAALGTVQALNTVTVKPQVGGQIEAIDFREGQEIAKGTVIARIDPRPLKATLDQALAKKSQDEAQLGAARATLRRYEELIEKRFVAAQDLENQRQTVRQLEAGLAGDDAAIASARLQLDYATVRAPIDGLAGLRQVDIGNVVQANASGIVVLTQIHPINVLFTLPEQNLDAVRSAAGAGPLKVEALDRSDNHVLASGTLAVIDNQIDTATGTFKLKAEFDNAGNALWPGQFVNVRLLVRTVSGGLVIPTQAVQRGPEGSYVFLVQDDHRVALRPLQLGSETGDGKVLVTSGLEEGQSVVTEGQFRLKAGSRVTLPGEAPPARPAAGGGPGTGAAPGERRRPGGDAARGG